MQYELPTILNKSELSYRLCISEQSIENMVEAIWFLFGQDSQN